MKDERETQAPVREDGEKSSKISAYGGYSTRHEYEKLRRGKAPWKISLITTGIIFLSLLALLGIFALIRGNLLPEKEESGSAGSIKVPTKSELSEVQKSTEEMIREVEMSLICVEVKLKNGSLRYGTGFILSDDGHAVCSSTLFDSEARTDQILAYTGDGFSSTAAFMGSESSLGLALLKLEGQFVYTPVTVENSSFLERGETLFAVGAKKAKVFYGTAKSGIVSSVGPAISFGQEGDRLSVNMLYADFAPNETLYGAPVVNEMGGTVGFCTAKMASPHPATASVVPINIVYAVVNELLEKTN